MKRAGLGLLCLVFLLPMLAAIIQSVWIFMDRPNQTYQALLHPHNYNPLWRILVVEVTITAAALSSAGPRAFTELDPPGNTSASSTEDATFSVWKNTT